MQIKPGGGALIFLPHGVGVPRSVTPLRYGTKCVGAAGVVPSWSWFVLPCCLALPLNKHHPPPPTSHQPFITQVEPSPTAPAGGGRQAPLIGAVIELLN